MVTVSSTTQPPRSHGLIRAIADGAIPEAEDLEAEALALEDKAREARRIAGVLRQLHAVATQDTDVISLALAS
jgi:hypothetical protein